MPEVSIIIVCMNRLDNLYPCLNTVYATTHVSFEIYVVAYMFSKENLTKAKADFPEVNFIENNTLTGFSENNNIALKKASGKYCFVLNDDTEIHENVIDKLVYDLEHLPENAAIVSPKINLADGSLQLCGRPPYPSINYVLQQFHLYDEPKDDTLGKTPVFDKVYKTTNITGAAFLIKTDIFKKLGWFDEVYYFTPEDIALSTLANNKGYGVYVDAGVTLIHKWRQTASKLMRATRPSAVRGSVIFFSRGNAFYYVLIGAGVWAAESIKRIKARFRLLSNPTPENRTKYLTFRNITRSIFTRKTTKEIFIKYYNELQEELKSNE